MQKNLFDFASENFDDKLKTTSKNNIDGHESSLQNSCTNTTQNQQTNSQNYNTETSSDSQNNTNSNLNPSLEEQAKTAYEKYQNYSQEELLSEFLTTSKQKLKDGSLTPQKLQNTVNSLSPFLNNTQKEFLKGLIDKLND